MSQTYDKAMREEVNRYFPRHEYKHTEILYRLIQNYKKISQDDNKIKEHFKSIIDIMNYEITDWRRRDALNEFLDMEFKNKHKIKKAVKYWSFFGYRTSDSLLIELEKVFEPFIIDDYGQFLLIESIKDELERGETWPAAHSFIYYLDKINKLEEIVSKLTNEERLIYNKYFTLYEMEDTIKTDEEWSKIFEEHVIKTEEEWSKIFEKYIEEHELERVIKTEEEWSKIFEEELKKHIEEHKLDGKNTRVKVIIRKKRWKHSLKKSLKKDGKNTRVKVIIRKKRGKHSLKKSFRKKSLKKGWSQKKF
jgi:hypothetical protein